MLNQLEPDPIFKTVFYAIAFLAILGMAAILVFIGLGIWKFMELIS